MEFGYFFDGGLCCVWLWMFNQGGNSMYFDMWVEVLVYLICVIDDGVINIDIGCMQINYYWYNEVFFLLEVMFDLVMNICYSVVFLSELYCWVGIWEQVMVYYYFIDVECGL